MIMDDFMGGGGKSAFGHLSNVGDEVVGYIIGDPEKKPDLDDDGVQREFPSGDPRWLWLIPIQTELRDDGADDGVRTLWLSWKSEAAFKTAVRQGWAKAGRVGKPVPEYGGVIRMWITGEEKTRKGTLSKNWAAEYIPPASAPQASEMMTEQPTSPAPQAPAPAAQAPARSTVTQVAQDQGDLLQRMQKAAAARRASGNLPPPPHHGQEEPPF